MAEGDGVIQVLIADDHALFRRGLRIVLDAEPDIEVVGEAADGEEAIALAEQLTPDVVLMDVRMPKIGGIEATAKLKESIPAARVVMLTVSDEEQDLFDAVKAGASGYLLKEVDPTEVADAIRRVQSGQALVPPAMASRLLEEFASLSAKPGPRTLAPRLTDRELEVLRQLAQGLSNREIGKALFISENTVKNHVRNILEKLHLHSRVEAVIYAVREKMLDIS
jgi:DNA-binding NarL/FixJ family response regulator